MSDDIDRWLKYSEFMGETKEALKDVRNELEKLNVGQSNVLKKINELNNKLTNQTIKIGITSGIIGLFAGLIVSLLYNVIA